MAKPQKKTPSWAAHPFYRCMDRLEDETRFLHLTMRGLEQLSNVPRLLEAVQQLNAEITRERTCVTPSPPHGKGTVRQSREEREDTAWLGREIDGGYPLLHAHSVVGIWSALEVYCEDLAVAWLTNRPEAWDLPAIEKIKAPVAQFARLSDSDRARFVIRELTRGRTAETSGVGVLDPLLDIFGLKPKYGDNIRRALHELWQVRNVVVHCGSVADQRLLDRCPWLPWRVGTRIVVSHRLYGWYHRAATRYAERVDNEVLSAYGDEICTCPGMDNVEDRPRDDVKALPGVSPLRALPEEAL